MSYHTTLERCRLALGTAKVLGAPAKGNPATSNEAKALGEAIAHLLPTEDRLEAHCLAAELTDLAHAQRDRTAATRLKLNFDTLTYHVEDDVAVAACLMAGFWDRNAASTHLAADWRDYNDTGVGMAGVATVEVHENWEWTGKQFVYES